MIKSRGRWSVLTVFSLILTASFTSAQPNPPGRRGPLAALPSPPGPHIAKIKALANKSWLERGPPAADPRWGRARGRSWLGKLPLTPELGGAFVFGEGVHGYTKPDGAAAERWVAAVNADARYGTWQYATARKPSDVSGVISTALERP